MWFLHYYPGLHYFLGWVTSSFLNLETLCSSVTGFTGRDGFPNNAHNVNEIPDVQDGYGLMISELLGNDMPNCSSVPGDLNALHNDMGLHNGEVLF